MQLVLLLGPLLLGPPQDIKIPGRIGFPLVTPELTFVGSSTGILHAFETRTGREIWRLDTNAPLYNQPVLEDGTVYVGGQDGLLRALDAASGKERWSFECGRVEWGFRDRFVNGKVTLVEGMVLFSSEDWNVYALDAETGEEFWRCKLGEEPQALELPVVDGVAYIGAWDGYLYAIDIGLGEIKWRSETDNDHIGRTLRNADGELYFKSDDPDGETLPGQSPYVTVVPIILDDTVYFSDWTGNLMAVERETGLQRWRFKADTPDLRHVGSRFTIVHGDDVLYFGTQEDHHLYAVDRTTGDELWRHELESPFSGPFPGAPGILLLMEQPIGGHGLRLSAFDPRKQTLLWTRDDAAGLPSIHEGTVHFGTRAGTLVGIDIRSGKESWRLET